MKVTVSRSQFAFAVADLAAAQKPTWGLFFDGAWFLAYPAIAADADNISVLSSFEVQALQRCYANDTFVKLLAWFDEAPDALSEITDAVQSVLSAEGFDLTWT